MSQIKKPKSLHRSVRMCDLKSYCLMLCMALMLKLIYCRLPTGGYQTRGGNEAMASVGGPEFSDILPAWTDAPMKAPAEAKVE